MTNPAIGSFGWGEVLNQNLDEIRAAATQAAEQAEAAAADTGWRGFAGTGGTQGVLSPDWEPTYESLGSYPILIRRTGDVVDIVCSVAPVVEDPDEIVFELLAPGYRPGPLAAPLAITQGTAPELPAIIQSADQGIDLIFIESLALTGRVTYTTTDAFPSQPYAGADPL